MPSLDEKYALLKSILKSCGKVGVAFSGGVDSTLLLKVAHDVLGDNVVALTASLRSVPEFELREAKDFCAKEQIVHLICEINELSLPEFVQNPPDRCYYCKRNVLANLGQAAELLGVTHIVEGTNADDMGDYRPGRRAVLETGVLSPLLDAGLSKQDIRALSARLGLSTWDKPSYACLASRIACGEPITEEKLRRVEKAEGFLLENGIRQMRVRVHGELARIEVPPESIETIARADFRQALTERFKELGFRYVSLDLEGYRTGSMNPKGE